MWHVALASPGQQQHQLQTANRNGVCVCDLRGQKECGATQTRWLPGPLEVLVVRLEKPEFQAKQQQQHQLTAE